MLKIRPSGAVTAAAAARAADMLATVAHETGRVVASHESMGFLARDLVRSEG